MQQLVQNTREKYHIFMGQRENVRVEKEQRHFAPLHCCQNMFFRCLLVVFACAPSQHTHVCLRTRPKRSWTQLERMKHSALAIKPMCNKHEEWFVFETRALTTTQKIMSSIFLSAFYQQNRFGITAALLQHFDWHEITFSMLRFFPLSLSLFPRECLFCVRIKVLRDKKVALCNNPTKPGCHPV